MFRWPWYRFSSAGIDSIHQVFPVTYCCIWTSVVGNDSSSNIVRVRFEALQQHSAACVWSSYYESICWILIKLDARVQDE